MTGSARHLVGRLSTGAVWAIDVPENWNGTLCLFSHGYGELGPDAEPDNAGDPVTKETLLRLGFALAGSSFSTAGWAVAESIPDQVAVVDEFRRRIGAPDVVVAWGRSMGGLITAGLAQEAPHAIDAAVPMCASVAGPIPMLNQGLDAAFVLTTLTGATGGIELVGVADDDMARLARGRALVADAWSSAEGRARLAFAAAVAQLPTWTSDNLDRYRIDPPEPSLDDPLGRLENQARVFHFAAFSPRLDLERRAGGNFSWNEGVDYAAQLERSGSADLVRWAYDDAGLDLDDDVDRLAHAPRIAPDPAAVEYMERNLTPDGSIGVPVLTVSITGDFAPTVTQTSAYGDVVAEAGNADLLRQVYVHAPGHCMSFSTAEIAASIEAADRRVRDGGWSGLEPAELLERATAIAHDRWPRLRRPRFASFEPAPHVRPYPRAERRLPLAPATTAEAAS